MLMEKGCAYGSWVVVMVLIAALFQIVSLVCSIRETCAAAQGVNDAMFAGF